MAQRFYFPSTGDAEVTPSYAAEWEQTTGATRRELVRTKISSSFATISDSEVNASSTYDVLVRQYVSESIGSHTFGGTWKLQVRYGESSNQVDFYAYTVLRVCSEDGSTIKGTLAAEVDDNEFSFPPDPLQNRSQSGSCAAIEAQNGDRIIVELGFRANNTKTTSYDGQFEAGDNSGSDLPEDDSSTDQYCPWIEFSQDIPYFVPEISVSECED